jgi:RhtB (resistance to homoserine/threonine) family protein
MRAFLVIAGIHLLAVMSPGPDFALVVQQSLKSRRAGILSATGMALGIGVHVLYSLLGIGLIISQSILLFQGIKLIGAAYLIFIGWKALTSKAPAVVAEDGPTKKTGKHALLAGFLCNALNPKATLFFLALFTQVIHQDTPLLIQLSYGVYMMLQTFLWFTLVACLLSLPVIKTRIRGIQTILERVMGGLLIALGLRVALSIRE